MPRSVAMLDLARGLRRNMTDAERRLWRVLREQRGEGTPFRRQHPIGPYIVDFVCLRARLVVEVDGGQHDAQAEADAERTRWLTGRGYRVVRFWNDDVLRRPSVVAEEIRRELLQRAGEHPTSS
jgi:very-short-patch-repair endonuclease